jgi:hypothetical protein
MLRDRWSRAAFVMSLLLLLGAVQLFVLSRPGDAASPWFLFGTDTVYHDAIVHLWVQQWMEKLPGVIPLWMPELQGGLPTLGGFLWTPFAPAALPFYGLPYPAAQKLAWLLCLWIAGNGAYLLARAVGLRFWSSVYTAMAWMLCGHLVTLIHAGHFQKVMALGWLPWVCAGVAMQAHRGSAARRAAGVAIGALGLGMILLSGHPQIAYTAGLLGVGYAAWAALARARLKRRFPRQIFLVVVTMAIGGALGSAQLIPGIEMAAVSNRGGTGIDYEEAVETSYPPGELLEYVIPRVKGSSVRGDVYTGQWGERIVSDFAGRGVMLLVVVGVMGLRRFRYQLFWIIVAVCSIVVGLGSYTPVYKALFYHVPGFATFRSPGTFMCAASLAFAVLAGHGWEALTHGIRTMRKRAAFPLIYAAVFLATVADLGWANRHFLLREPWEPFQRGYLATNELDLWLAEKGIQPETHDEKSELRLRQILSGGMALNGYHPVYYAVKGELDPLRFKDHRAWLTRWGISHVLRDPNAELRTPDKRLALFPAEGIQVVKIGPTRAELFRETAGPDAVYTWVKRWPNEQVLHVSGNGGPLRLPEIKGPGFELSIDGMLMKEYRRPEIEAGTMLNPGAHDLKWTYRPFSYRLGLFATALALGMVTALAGYAAFHRPPQFIRLYEEGGPDPHHR